MWIGACTSTIGTWMQTLAQSWLVLQISGSPFYLGLDSFLGQIPIFLLSMVGGVLADRMDRRHLLLFSQVIQMTCAFTLAGLVASGVVHVWHILSLSFCVGVAQSIGGPAYQSLIPQLVKSEDLPNAIAMNSIQFNLARVIGPVLGGIALSKLGASWCFSLNGVSYVAVIITLLMIRSQFQKQDNPQRMLDSMKQGIAFIRERAAMGSLIVIAFLMTMLGLPLIVFLPVFARDIFHQGADGFTAFLVASGLGSIVGALLVATFHHGRQKGRMAVVNLLLLGLVIVGFATSRTLWLSYGLLFIGSSLLISAFALISSLVQIIATDKMRGRVMSIYNVAFRGGMPFGGLISGKLAETYGVPTVVAANGALLACLGLYILVMRKRVSEL